jgi:hypothetical protein
MGEAPVAAKVVEFRRFAGLGHEEIAAALGITVYLARQKWTLPGPGSATTSSAEPFFG